MTKEPVWFEGKKNRYEAIEEDDGGVVVIGHRPDGTTFEAARQSSVVVTPVQLKVAYVTQPDGSVEILEVEERPADEESD
jgi:hypothetical protein